MFSHVSIILFMGGGVSQHTLGKWVVYPSMHLDRGVCVSQDALRWGPCGQGCCVDEGCEQGVYTPDTSKIGTAAGGTHHTRMHFFVHYEITLRQQGYIFLVNVKVSAKKLDGCTSWSIHSIASFKCSKKRDFRDTLLSLGPRIVVNTGEVDSFGTMSVKRFVDTQEIVFNVRAERDAQVGYELREYIK